MKPPEPPTPPPPRIIKDSHPVVVLAVGLLGWCLILLAKVGLEIWRLLPWSN